MKELINKIITKIEFSSGKDMIVFTDGNGEKIAYETFGDCCSSSWFEKDLQNVST